MSFLKTILLRDRLVLKPSKSFLRGYYKPSIPMFCYIFQSFSKSCIIHQVEKNAHQYMAIAKYSD